MKSTLFIRSIIVTTILLLTCAEARLTDAEHRAIYCNSTVHLQKREGEYLFTIFGGKRLCLIGAMVHGVQMAQLTCMIFFQKSAFFSRISHKDN